MNERGVEALTVYAAAAAAYEDAKSRLSDATNALDDAQTAALDAGAREGLPAVVSLSNGQHVTVEYGGDDGDGGPGCLNYTLARTVL